MAAGKFIKIGGKVTLKIEKPPGWDWIVFYLWSDEPETESMSVFGQMTPENALAEARYSLGMGGSDYEILGLVRADQNLPL